MLLVIITLKKYCNILWKVIAKNESTENLEWNSNFRDKAKNYISNEKVMVIYLIVGLIKKMLLYKMSYFPKLHTNKNKIEF